MILQRLAQGVVRRRRIVIGLVVAATLVAGYGASRVRLNADFSTYLEESDPLVRAYNYIGKTFAGNSTGIVLVTAPDVFDPEVLGLLDRLTEAYREVDGISYVTSLSNVVDFRKTEWGIEVGRLLPSGSPPETRAAADSLRAYVMGKDRFVGNLVSADGTVAAILLRFEGSEGAAGSSEFETAGRVRDATEAAAPPEVRPDEVEIYYGGMPFLIFNMTLLITENLTILIPLMVGVLLLVLYLGLRRWGGVVYPLAVVLVSTIWTVGIMGFLGLNLDLLTGIMPVILIALGSADGIHYMKRYFERRAAGDPPPEAARTSYTEMGLPMVLTTLTTMVGFASLAISDFAVIRQFGLITALGLFLALVVTLTLLPALTSYGAGRAPKGPQTGPPVLGRLAEAMGRFVHRRKGLVLLGSAGLVVAGGVAIPRIVKDVDWTLCLQKGSAPFHAEMLLREKFGGSLPIQILVDGDLKDPATLRVMRSVERRLEALPLVSKSQSIAGVIAEMNDVMNGRYAIPEERAGVANLWLLIENEEMMEQLVAREDSQALVQARLANWHTASVSEAVDSVKAFLDAFPTRLAVVDLQAVAPEARDSLLALRRREATRLLSWDLARWGLEARADALEAAVATLYRWTPSESDYAALQDTLENYLLSPEAELPLSAREARRVAGAAMAAWREGRVAPDAGRLTAAVQATLPGVDPFDAEALALSLEMVGRDAMGAARVESALRELERAVPGVAAETLALRDARGTLWEAAGPSWAVDARVAEGLGVEEGQGLERVVEARFARSGMASVLMRMEERLTPTQVESLLTTLIFVIALLALVFRSAAGGLLTAVPLMVTILVNFGVMGYLGIGLDSFTAMVASIAIGLGIDYAIHFTHRYRTQLAEAGDTATALSRTMTTTGVAVIVNAASVGLGFLVLLAAGGQHIRRFGGLAALTMLVAGFLTLTLLPALFLWVRPKFLKVPETTRAGGRGAAEAATVPTAD